MRESHIFLGKLEPFHVAVFGCQLTTLLCCYIPASACQSPSLCIGKDLDNVYWQQNSITHGNELQPRRLHLEDSREVSQIFEGNSPSHSMSHVLGVNSLPCCAAIFLPVLVKAIPMYRQGLGQCLLAAK